MNIRKAPSPPHYIRTPDGRWIKEADMDEVTSNDAEAIIEADVDEGALPPEDEPGEDDPSEQETL